MLKTYLIDPEDGTKFTSNIGQIGRCLVVAKTEEVLGTFKSTTRNSAGTSIVTQPDTDGSIYLTDLLITADRVNGATVTIRFTDDIDIINIFVADTTDAPVNLAIPFKGNWQGWKNARLEVVTTGNVTATVAVGYYKIPSNFTLNYEPWDAKR